MANQGMLARMGIMDLYPDEPIKVYRANPQNRWGAKDRLEPTATVLDKGRALEYAHAIKQAEQFGGPKLTPKELANYFLVEGRSDAGFNGIDEKNKKVGALADKIGKMGFGDEGSEFAAHMWDKHQTANRLKIPLPVAWNGTGKSSESNKTGWDYNKRYQESMYAVDHPKNAEFLNTIQMGLSDDPKIQAQVQAQIKQNMIDREAKENAALDAMTTSQQPTPAPTPAPVDVMGNVTNMKKGGYIVKPIKGGLKLI